MQAQSSRLASSRSPCCVLPTEARPLRRARLTAASSSASSADASSGPPVLVVPAFYLDAAAFRPLVKELRSRGFNAALPPVRWTDWVPTLGGRSVRPILDRVDWALTQLLEGHEVNEEDYEVPLPRPAAFSDWLSEFRDASKGAQPALQLTGPWKGSQRAALVASSAGGWICRILLSRGPHEYSNAVFHGADRVHTLVTLGTPHVSAEPVTRRNIDFVNTHYAGVHCDDVRYVAVGSKTVQGKVWGPIQDFAFQSYNICCGNGSVWGDGVTPLECALALEGAHLISLEGAEHVPLSAKPEKGQHWYGSGQYLEEWVHWLHRPAEGAGLDAAAQATRMAPSSDAAASSSV